MAKQTDKQIQETGLRLIQYLKRREASAPKTVEEEVWQHILSTTELVRRKRRRYLYIAGLAACLLCLLGLFFVQSYKTSNDDLLQIAANMNRYEPLDSIKEIQLHTSSGEHIQVAAHSQLISHEKGNAVYVDDKKVSTISPEKETEEITYNVVVVPKGKHIRLALSDGSTMHINSGSRVVYPHKFQPQKREIYVDGEIYIDVKKQENIPFIVRTQQFAVNVLGTAFNVRSYPDEQEAEIVLQRGKIKIEDSQKHSVTMTPNELVTLHSGKYIDTRNVDAAEYITWINGILIFKGESMANVVKRLNHFYGEEIRYTPQAGLITLYGKLDVNEPLELALEALAATADLIVTKKDNFIEIAKRE